MKRKRPTTRSSPRPGVMRKRRLKKRTATRWPGSMRPKANPVDFWPSSRNTKTLWGVFVFLEDGQKSTGFALGLIDPGHRVAVRFFNRLFRITPGLGDDLVVGLFRFIDQPFHVLIRLVDLVERRLDRFRRVDVPVSYTHLRAHET